MAHTVRRYGRGNYAVAHAVRRYAPTPLGRSPSARPRHHPSTIANTVGAAIGRPPELTASQFCHCEPVTDVTGVAIRFPLRSDYRLRCVL